MNYQTLKNIIENLINSYKCPSCSSEVGNDSVEIVGAAGNTLNINVCCPECKKNAMIRTEVATLDLSNISGSNIPKQIQGKIQSLKNELNIKKSTIKDQEIVELNRKLKSISGVDDLFSEK